MAESVEFKLNLEPNIHFDEKGIYCDFYSNEKDEPVISVFDSWENLFMREIENQCVPAGMIAVQEEFDGVAYLNELSDALKSASDDLTEKVRQKQIILLNKLIEGISIDDATVSFSTYMKGEYD